MLDVLLWRQVTGSPRLAGLSWYMVIRGPGTRQRPRSPSDSDLRLVLEAGVVGESSEGWRAECLVGKVGRTGDKSPSSAKYRRGES